MSLSHRLNRQTLVKATLLALVAFLPLHVLLVSAFSFENNTLNLVLRSWKEVLLIAGLVLVLPDITKRQFYTDKLNLAIFAYATLHFLYALLVWEGYSTALGLRINLSFLAVFLIARTIEYKSNKLSKLVESLVVALGVIVSVTAILHILAPELFAGFALVGIGNEAIFIQDSQVVRAHGIMSGPLQLGSYLVLPILIAFHKFIASRDKEWVAYLALMLLAVFFSYSRGALIGIAVGGLVIMAWKYRSVLSKRLVLGLLGAGVILAAFVVWLALSWRPLSLVVFHAEPAKALSESSTVDHFVYAWEGMIELVNHPFGKGVGSAGPASYYTDELIITENYFIQVGIEVGVVGVALFGLITYMLLRRLFHLKQIVLLSAVAGLSVMNLLLHTWADVATAWTIWALAGLTLAGKPDR